MQMTRLSRRAVRRVLAIGALGSLAACDDAAVVGPDAPPLGATGTVVVQLAGAAASRAASDPGDGHGSGNGQGQGSGQPARFSLDSVGTVELHVVRVDARREDADSLAAADSATSDAEKGRGGWTTVAEPNARIDLMKLSGQPTTLGSAALPAGTYRSLRLVVDAARSRVTLRGGQAVDVKWPSAGRSGIKVQLQRDVTIGKDSTSALRLDFDVEESFVARGASLRNGLLFKPVIRAGTR
jgi:hypothetical protein